MAKKKRKKQRKRKRLTANSMRQAHNQVRGYLYQIWHSVNAWLDLADDEILYLEGAEDFDTISDDTATATQVKDTQRNITLRSQEVNDAINHYWELRNNNSDRRVKFRFLTRSKIGVEQGNPFGKGEAGLQVWKRCSGNEAVITKISQFLQLEGKISDEIKIFLKQADPQKIYKQLIEPIAWETDSKDASYVEQSINEKLVRHGHQLGVLPSEAKKVLDALLKAALKVATKKENRVLTKVRFFEIFEAETTQRVPIQYLRHLQKQVTRAAALNTTNAALTGHSPDIAVQSHSPIQTGIPPLYPNVAPRTDLLKSIQVKLQSDSVVVIQGGINTGKTTLAKLTANAIGGSWFWLNLREKDPSQVTQLLHQLDAEINNQSLQINIVLDDLNLQSQQLRAYEEDLGVVVYRVLERGAKLLITSQYKPPNNLIRNLGLPSSVVINVSNFTIPDIEQFARQLGCPPEKAKTWAGLFRFPTKRHPRLVHALFAQLRKTGWKQQDVIESILQTPPALEKEFEEAQQLLAGLPEDQQEFLYRLSLVITEFRRDYALNIAEIPESISYPGRVFRQLVDPWMDQVDKTYYTLSPLLSKAAEQVWSESEINRLHAEIANAILKAKDITTIEAGAILRHSRRGENREGLIAIIWGLIAASEDDWEIVSKEFSLLIPMEVDLPEELYLGDPFVKYFIRFLQYRITAKVKPAFAPKILEVWDKETKTQKQSEEYRFLRQMLAMEALRYNQVLLPVKKMVDYLQEIIELTNSDAEIQDVHGNFMEQIEEYKTNKSSIFSILFSFVWTRPPVYAPFLSDLVDALDELQPEIRMLLLTDFEEDSVESGLLIDSIWLAEAKREKQDWTRCLQVFDKVIEKTIAWGYPYIAAASARGKAIVHDEKLNDPDAAHQVLQDISLKIGTLPSVEEEQALVYLRQKCYKDALNIYERLLPEWNPPSEQLGIGPLEEYRRAASCAANLGDWKKAATFLEDGAKKTQKIEDTERYIGLYADAGFAQFKAGNMLDCIKLLNLALQKFETLPQDNTNLNYFTLKKRLGHAIGWMTDSENRVYFSESDEPSIGFCSDTKINEEVLDLPDHPIEYTWLALAKIEYKFGHGTAILDYVWQITDWEDPDLVLMNSLFLLKTRYDFKNKTFDELPERIHQLAGIGEGLEEDELASIPIAAIPDFTSVENITIMLVASVLVQLPISVDIHEILVIWRANSSELPIKANLNTAFDLIESMLLGDQNNALTVMKKQESKPEERLTAALKIVHDSDTSPDNLFHAHLLITTCLINNLIWLDPVAPNLAELLSVQWLEKIKLRAALKTPMLTVPEIEQACKSSETGKKKIGQILLAAYQAVTPRVTPETLQQFRSWSESEPR